MVRGASSSTSSSSLIAAAERFFPLVGAEAFVVVVAFSAVLAFLRTALGAVGVISPAWYRQGWWLAQCEAVLDCADRAAYVVRTRDGQGFEWGRRSDSRAMMGWTLTHLASQSGMVDFEMVQFEEVGEKLMG